MKLFNPARLLAGACASVACLVLLGFTPLATAASRDGSQIVKLYFDHGGNVTTCDLAVPDIVGDGPAEKTYTLSSTTGCYANEAFKISLKNVPSATYISFFSTEDCAVHKPEPENDFYFKIKTRREPTNWVEPYESFELQDFLVLIKDPANVPNYNIRVEQGGYANLRPDEEGNVSMNNRLSCVKIQR